MLRMTWLLHTSQLDKPWRMWQGQICRSLREEKESQVEIEDLVVLHTLDFTSQRENLAFIFDQIGSPQSYYYPPRHAIK